ncbi:hypothetical protein BH11ARM2_BH11ARM2_37690 [soil metagenome]
MKTIFNRFLPLVALLLVAPAAMAHDVPCPLCGLKLVQATKDQDNEVVLRFGKKKIEYRCVYCALADSGKYDGDLIVYAPSETKGKPVLLQRTGGKWSAVKEAEGKLVADLDTVILNDFKSHAQCAMLSRAFHTKAGFDKYVAANKVAGAKALSVSEMAEAVAKG